MRIGVDVGGTHTDAVLFDGGKLIAAHKALTSHDIESGVLAAVREVLKQSSVAPAEIEMMTLGTTQFTNAVVERKSLAPVAAIRIGAQSSSAMPVGAKWPKDIYETIAASHMIDGGFDYDGAPIVPLDEDALRDTVGEIKKSGVTSIAVTSVFATSNPESEKQTAAAIIDAIPDARIALSHELGRIGIYQRENATILNAALLELSEKVIAAFKSAFASLDLTCPLFISQNDGTLMAAEFAKTYPVFTFSSGPTNSMRGAAFLSGVKDAMVVDVGGTTSDIGMLIDGFPRPSGAAVSIGGVLTNFRMPDVLAVGLGGGSHVSDDGEIIGPKSVGRDLPQKGRVFGGDQLTSTDIAVAAGRAEIGEKSNVESLFEDTVATALSTMKQMLADNVDKMKISAGDLPLIVVGGGGFLVPYDLPGVSETLRPENAGVANAIGAAFAQIGGEAETIYAASKRPRAEALNEAKEQATQKAITAGAIPDSVEIVEIDETPMTYTDEPGAVIRVKAVGDADIKRVAGKAS